MSYKIVNTEQLEADLASVADSIRAKSGASGKLDFPSGFKSAVDGMQVGGTEIKNQDITITENGTYTPASGYTGFSSVKVEVESSGGGSMFETSAVGIIPDIPKGFANSTLTIDFETNASGALS